MLPGAVDVLPLKVQSSAVPLLMTAHVSVTCAPLTPKLALATPVRVSAMLALMLTPPYEARIDAFVGVFTIWVFTVKLAFVLPAATLTIAGTTAVPSLASETSTPPLGAAPVKVTVAVVLAPPITVDGLTVSAASTSPGDTVNADDWRLAPFIAAVIVALPGATPVTRKVAVVPLAATVTDAGTVATDGLLLDSETLAPALPAAFARVTVPCTVAPGATLAPESVTLAMLPLVGIVGEPEPQPAAVSAASAAATRST
ncbi:MAG TPA: hypothetical protein VGL62_00700 [Vicinamibacterales bacterium]|jgi:hypothetical protein